MGNEDSYRCAVLKCLLPRSIEVGICGQLRKQIMMIGLTSTFGMAGLYLSHSCTLNAIISVACSSLISQPIHVQHPMEKGQKIEGICKLITLEIGTTTRECK